MLEYFNRRSCIAATRIGIDVLDYFGVKAEPLPLFVLVMNGEALDLLGEGMSQAELGVEMRKYGPDEPGGPWSIGVGAVIENSPDWAGHVVIAVPNEGALLDLAIDQASRPHKGLPIPDEGQLFPIDDEDWWSGQHPRTAFAGRLADLRMGLVLDRNCPDPEGFKRSPNWRRDGSGDSRRVFREVTGTIIRLVKDELENTRLEPDVDDERDHLKTLPGGIGHDPTFGEKMDRFEPPEERN
jgi:hypothetical protein